MNGIKTAQRHVIPRKLQDSYSEEIWQQFSSSERKEEHLKSLNDIFNLITNPYDVQQMLVFAADKAMEIMDLDAILIFMLDQVSHKLELKVSKGVTEKFASSINYLEVPELFDVTMTQMKAEFLSERSRYNPLMNNEAIENEGIRSGLFAPMVCNGQLIGTLCGAKRVAGKFSVNDLLILTSIGNVVSAAIASVTLHKDMKQTLAQLQQSEEKYRNLFENAYDAIWVHDLDGKMLAANKSCEKITGCSRNELMEKSICEMMPERTRYCHDMIEKSLLQCETVGQCFEGEVVKKGDGKAIIQVCTNLLTNEGKPIGYQHCARDMTDERQLQENLHYYLRQITRAQEEERKRIARELHDETLQRLITISRQLDKIFSSDALWEESLHMVRGFKEQIELAAREMRRFSQDLRPSVLDDLGLLPALELLADDLEQRGVTANFEVYGEAGRLEPEIEVMLFRIAQEAIKNIWRHAKASNAELAIEFGDKTVKLIVKDNGTGFKAPPRIADLANFGKLGLVGMYERAELLGGSIVLMSSPKKGTTVTVQVPIQA